MLIYSIKLIKLIVMFQNNMIISCINYAQIILLLSDKEILNIK